MSMLTTLLVRAEIAVLWLVHQLFRVTVIGVVITLGIAVLPVFLSVGVISDLTDALRERLLISRTHRDH
jgi:hypothetical protein